MGVEAQKLRQAVLQAAIEGKLVPQDPNDEPASVLLERIADKKAQLVDDGKLRKQKELPPVKINEQPFDVPDSWEWCRYGEVASSTLGKTLNKAKDTGVPVEYLCSINIQNDTISLSTVKKAPFTETERQKYRLQPGDLLICEGGDAGKSAIWNIDREMYYQNALHCSRFHAGQEPYYIKLLLDLYRSQGLLTGASKGMTIQHLVQATLNNLIVPLPPLAEQHRIVAKIAELMPLIDEFEKLEDELNDLEAGLPEKLKQAVLQAGIEGKLVSQDPNDEPASILLERIANEKERLIKDGKLRKQKVLPPVADEERTFSTPEGWVWIRLGELGEWRAGATPSKSNQEYHHDGTIPWLLTGDLNDGYIDSIPQNITEKAVRETSVSIRPSGTVLMAMYGATIGKLGILTSPATTNQACCGCEVFRGVDNLYLFYFLLSHRDAFVSQGAGSGQPNISKEKIVATPFALPPTNEQRRIVARIDEIMPVIDSIKQDVSNA